MSRRVDLVCPKCEDEVDDFVSGAHEKLPFCANKQCNVRMEIYWKTEAPSWYFNRRVDKNPAGMESAGRKGTI